MSLFMSPRRATATLMALLASAGAGCGSGSADKAGGRGAAGHVQTLRLHSGGGGPGGYFPLITKLKAPNGENAGWAKTDPVADSSGAGVGFKDEFCVEGGIKGRADCTVTLTLKKGTIVATGVYTDADGVSGKLSVTGGTGAYEGARGTFQDTVPGPNPQLIVVHLLLP